MKGVYGSSVLLEFHDILLTEFEYIRDNLNKNMIYDEDLDKICKLILINNSCMMSDKVTYRSHELINSHPGYFILFVEGAKGNKICDFYDYIEFYGAKYMVIFIDKFKAMFIDQPDAILGRSMYVDNISKLVDLLIATTTCITELSGGFTSCAANNNYRFAPMIIACDIINRLFTLSENDVSTIDYNDIMKMLNNISLALLLIGNRYTIGE